MEHKPFIVTTSAGSFNVMARDVEHAVDIADARIERDARILKVAADAGKALEALYPWGYGFNDSSDSAP